MHHLSFALILVHLFIGATLSSTITEWTLYTADTAPHTWSYHRGLFSSADNTIYLIGHSYDPVAFDLETQLWSYDTRLPSTDQDISIDGQWGTVVGNTYYYQDYSNSGKLNAFDFVTPSWTESLYSMYNANRDKCITSNGVDTVYMMYGNDFWRLDVSAATPATDTVEDVVDDPIPQSVVLPQCAYYNGYVYAFGGNGIDQIARIYVDTDDFKSASWETLTVTMPNSGMKEGEAVLAGNGLIYIGGFRNERTTVLSFDPENQVITVEANLNKDRLFASMVYSSYDNRLYALLGTAGDPDGLEFSNPLAAVSTCGAPANFTWEELMKDETGKPYVNASLSINEATLALNIEVDLDYLGASQADHNGYVYGTTYVIDFEDYSAHSDDIRLPGSCQNREDVLSGATWGELWAYSETPDQSGHIGSTSYLAYPPSGVWSVQMSPDDSCGTIQYSTSLTWDQLTGCTDYNGGEVYIETVDRTKNITLSGTLYVNVVSPFAHNFDYEFYRVYQLLSQPFQIVVSKTVYVIDATGINLLTIDFIAVYKEDNENRFKLIVLTESAEYLQLTRLGLGDTLLGFDADVSTGLSNADFSVNESTESDGCLTSKSYICSQLWKITVDNAQCSPANDKYTDFSGSYSITFEAECRSDLGGDTELITYCEGWLLDHRAEIVDAGTDKVVLSTDLVWKDEICDPLIFDVQFAAAMTFYVDDTFSIAATDTHLYQVGEDPIYVSVETSYPSTHFAVFETELVNVWLCTFDPLKEPYVIQVGNDVGGCFSNNTDTDAFDGHDGHIYDDVNDVVLEGFELDSESGNVVRFLFVVPKSIRRDKLYVHAQIEVSLVVGTTSRRMLLDIDMDAKQSNQMDHFVDKVGLTRTGPVTEPKPPMEPIHNYPQQPQPQAPPQQPFVISLRSPWVIAVGGLLALILTVNIGFMCYMNCNTKRRTYSAVKSHDSEFDSERDAINVASESN